MDREEARRGIRAWLLCRKGLSVKRGVHKVDVFLVHPVLRQPQTLTEALEMNDLARSEEFNDVVDVGIIGKTQNVVICGAGFLLCGDLVRTTFLPQSWENFLYARFCVIITLNLEVCQF